MHIAGWNNRTDAVDLLLKYGASLDIKVKKKLRSGYSHVYSIVIKDKDGGATCLHWLAKFGRDETMSYLIKAGASALCCNFLRDLCTNF